jgi:tetratricopeptide (TPR) repeat protein
VRSNKRGKRPVEHQARADETNDDLEALTREARCLGQKGDWGPKATGVNTRILELHPDNLAALTRRARCFFEQDAYPAARKDYIRALQVYPGSKLVQEALAKIERGWDAARERKQRRAAKARGRIERRRAEAEELRRVETLTSFEEARGVGIKAAGAETPNYPLAIAAFKKAYELDPRRKFRLGEAPLSGLFEIPTRLARVYRKSDQLYQAQRMYEWILERHDSRAAKVGLAAVHEDKGRHSVALGLYEEVLSQNPNNPYALRGLARTLSSLDRTEEAVEAYEKALEGAESPTDVAAAAVDLKEMREELKRKEKVR